MSKRLLASRLDALHCTSQWKPKADTAFGPVITSLLGVGDCSPAKNAEFSYDTACLPLQNVQMKQIGSGKDVKVQRINELSISNSCTPFAAFPAFSSRMSSTAALVAPAKGVETATASNQGQESSADKAEPKTILQLLDQLAKGTPPEQDAAIDALEAKGKEVLATLEAKPSGLASLVQALKLGSERSQEAAIAILREACMQPYTCGALQQAGGVGPLVAILSSGASATVRQSALTILGIMCVLADSGLAVWEACGMAPIVGLLRSGSPESKVDGMMVLHKMCMWPESRAAFRQAGGIPMVIEQLKSGIPMARTAAPAVLASLAEDDNAARCSEMWQAGAVPALVDLIKTGEPMAKHDAAIALFAIIGGIGGPGGGALQVLSVSRDAQAAGAVPALVEMLKHGTPSAQMHAMRALEAVLIGGPPAILEVPGGVEVLVRQAASGMDMGKEAAKNSLQYLAEASEEGREAIRRAGGPAEVLTPAWVEEAKQRPWWKFW